LAIVSNSPDPHNIVAGDTVDVYWSAADGWRESRLGMTVDSVSDEDVEISGGTGDDLPVDNTILSIGPHRVRPNLVGVKLLSGSDLRTTHGDELSATLQTRTSDTVGVLDFPDADHGILKGEELFLFWSSSGFARARVTAVSGDDATFVTDGIDDVLPSASTAITVTHYTAIEVGNFWNESISPGSLKCLEARAMEREDGTLEILIWSCKASPVTNFPPIPPA
jgi:hypothetical protein